MIAIRFLPPLAVIAAMALPAALLRPARVIEPVMSEPVMTEPVPEEARHPEDADMTWREREVEGCFLEWEERGGGDTEMTARVDIDPEGMVLVTTHGGPDHPALRTCVETAILRTQYPIGHTLSLHLDVTWTAHRLKISPELIEAYRGPTTAETKQKLAELKREHARIVRELAKRRAQHH